MGSRNYLLYMSFCFLCPNTTSNFTVAWTVLWRRKRWRCIWLSCIDPYCQKIMARPFLNYWTTGYFSRRFATNNNEIMIARDLHFHDCYPQRVVNRTQVCGLQQLGAKSTSVLGHTLDATTCDPGPCYHIKKLARDHFAVGFIKAIFKPSHMHKTVSNRTNTCRRWERFQTWYVQCPSHYKLHYVK